MRVSPRSLIAGVMLAVAACAAQAADKQPTLRPEVGKPLQEAQASLQAKNYSDALAKIGAAEQVGNLSPYEAYIVARMRAVAAAGAGDNVTALKAYEAVLSSGQLPDAEKVSTMDGASRLAYMTKNYGKAADYIQQYRAAGGTNAQVLSLLPQAQYLANDFADAQKELKALIADMQKSGQKPREVQLQLLASCAVKLDDKAGYVDALALLVADYPQERYWQDLIARTAGKPGFSDRLALDVYRLKMATGTMSKPGEYMDATQLALQAGLPGEADRYIKQGYASQALGSGADAERQKRLKDLVAKKLVEDKATLAEGEKAAAGQAGGDALVATGLNYVGYGQYDKGIALIQQGIAKGGLKKPEEAKLHLGYAQLMAGKQADAYKTLKAVGGNDGTADIAQLWTLVRKGA